MGLDLMNPLDRIITIEITCDQACALMGAIDQTRLEFQKWLETHADASEGSRKQTREMDEMLANVHEQLYRLTGLQEAK